MPVPLGSPHWSTKIPLATSRWHLVWSKYFLSARCWKLATVHGVSARSILIVMGPRLVVICIVAVPVRGALLKSGTPTALMLGWPVSGVAAHDSGVGAADVGTDGFAMASPAPDAPLSP